MSAHTFFADARCSFGLAGLSAQAITGNRLEATHALQGALEAAELAEKAGLDAIWATEHHFAEDGYLPSPWILLAAIAARTKRVALATSVALPGLHDPVRLAEDLFVLDHLSGGRLMAGFGLGYRRAEFVGLGQDLSARRQLLVRSIEVLRAASAGAPIIGHGGVAVRVTPAPPRPAGPPILVGAFAEAGVRRAAQIADGFIAPDMPLRHLRQRLAWLEDEGAFEREFAVVVTLSGFIGDADRALPGITHVHRQYARWLLESGDGVISPGAGSAGSRSLPSHLATGSAEQVLDQLGPYVEALEAIPGSGPRHLCLRLTYPGVDRADNLASINAFATEVVPSLRTIGGAR